MHRPLPRHDDAVAAQRDLRDNIRPARILAPHFVDLLFERQFLGDRLQRREGDRQPGFAAQIAHPLELVPLALQRSEEHTSELQSLMRISYAVFCLKKKNQNQQTTAKM